MNQQFSVRLVSSFQDSLLQRPSESVYVTESGDGVFICQSACPYLEFPSVKVFHDVCDTWSHVVMRMMGDGDVGGQ